MERRFGLLAVVGLVLSVATAPGAAAEHGPYYFGVLNQRSVALTAQYWNPILAYVSSRSGVPLVLKMGKTAVETTDMTVRGEFAFAYTNHLFTPERVKLGFRVIARTTEPSIRATIVVPADSALGALGDLHGKSVVFPSHEAFVGYWVPMDAFLKAGVAVTPSFAGNQEGAIAQLQAGKVEAAAVNAQVLEDYARREGFVYRTLWTSEGYHGLPIMASASVPRAKVEAVRQAFIHMGEDAEGQRALRAGAELLKLKEPVAFVPATDRDYENYRRFYQSTVVTTGHAK
jgi:phosphonate transport system substrate-binding protein